MRGNEWSCFIQIQAKTAARKIHQRQALTFFLIYQAKMTFHDGNRVSDCSCSRCVRFYLAYYHHCLIRIH